MWWDIVLFAFIAMPWFPACITAICNKVCPYCRCNGPSEWQVVFDGFADDACTGCSDINGTWIVPYQSFGGSGTSCIYRRALSKAADLPNLRTFQNGLCGTNFVFGDINLLINAGQIRCYIAWNVSLSEGESHEFKVTGLGNPYRCCTVTDLNIPWFQETTSETSKACDSQSATCTVTAA